ncbi:MAG: hypothetical protein HYX27_11815 [Acidobacteria bacterium]|nr:hypothetical protein [Acidobacteriota bacterium]
MGAERIETGATLREMREQAERALEKLRSLPVIGPILTDKDLYDDEGFPR